MAKDTYLNLITLLYVEDEEDIKRELKEVLELQVKKLYTAKNGKEGLNSYIEYKPDIILSDIKMPIMNGLTMAKEIKKIDKDIPIIITTAFNEKDYLMEAIEIGIDKYIIKPININSLFETLNSVAKIVYQEKELHKKETLLEEYKKAVDRSAIVSKTDINGNITYVNREFCRISGYKKDELIGKNHNIVRHPDMSKELFEEMWNTIKAKMPWQGIIKNKTKNGNTYWVDTLINPIIDESGNIIEFIAIRNDITDIQKKIKDGIEEIRKKEQLLELNNRHAQMGQMIASLTHQWKQPLQGILLALDYIKYILSENLSISKDDNLEANKMIKTIQEQVKFLSETMKYFKNFFKPTKKMEIFSVIEACENVINLLKNTYENIEIELKGDKKLLMKGYPNEFYQVIINLLNNSQDAFIERNIKTPKVEIDIYQIDNEIIINFCDNGGGIAENIINTIFEQYVSTKKSKGMGIGLHLIASIIHKINGRVEVKNINDGVCFYIYLPLNKLNNQVDYYEKN